MNERDEEILGKALGRAVDAQLHRETPYQASRLAAALERPARSPLFVLGRLAFAAAVILLAVFAGGYLSQLRANLPPATTPTPSDFVVVPTPTSGPTASPAPTPLPYHAFVYCSREGAPPFAVSSLSAGIGATPEERIASRLKALEQLQPAQGACENGFASPVRVAGVTVQGDVATVDYTVPGDDWQRDATAATDGLVQQIVYTASEEPGIRRVRITQNGGQAAHVRAGRGQGVGGGFTAGVRLANALAREDVLGYAVRTETSQRSDDDPREAIATATYAVDDLAPGLARFVIELEPKAKNADPRWTPQFNATLRRYDEDPQGRVAGKWALEIDVPGAEQRPTNVRATQVDRTPLRWIEENQLQAGGQNTMRYTLYLDDARPWRIGWAVDPVRIVVDLGGPVAQVKTNVIVYAPVPGEQNGRGVRIIGAARVFEANVQWRVRDGANRIVAEGHTTASIGNSPIWGLFQTDVAIPQSAGANVTLDVYNTSPRDGAILDIVSIPLVLR